MFTMFKFAIGALILFFIFNESHSKEFIKINSKHQHYSFVPVQYTKTELLIRGGSQAKILLSTTSAAVPPFFEITISGDPNINHKIAQDSSENIQIQSAVNETTMITDVEFTYFMLMWDEADIRVYQGNFEEVIRYNSTGTGSMNFIGFAASEESKVTFMMPYMYICNNKY
ncbi:PREDICTED: uncharacterized protein LOC108561997 [Nicrophorus vespilloides]|uniref:Uncharacterized protein LOC108561997 n=1 Tax=Nicrophorus vespilloides TaxID=110193 RepID=A0ABM1MM52_NICVS|nr:PREDICTED: uncharacterized protein LOC108561997 [Nicrophorus vespilloides]